MLETRHSLLLQLPLLALADAPVEGQSASCETVSYTHLDAADE